ncbi:hypothetical protein HanPSC8_Chr05g0223301 [Helianthus annuus]|nr:hypothetical protein HanPSC8_Chr05g0223301 [Helianthus annuus]
MTPMEELLIFLVGCSLLGVCNATFRRVQCDCFGVCNATGPVCDLPCCYRRLNDHHGGGGPV